MRRTMTTDDKDDDTDDLFIDAMDFYKRASEAESDNRIASLDDWKFARASEQWDPRDRQSREKEGRPCLTINRLPAFIRQVVNDSRKNKPAIKVHPVDDEADVETADIYNGLIRNIEVISNADIAYDTAIDCAVTGGFGYLRVTTDYAHDDTFDLDILINRVNNPFTVYGDPDGCAGDGSDWMEAMVTSMMPKDEFEKRWSDADCGSFMEGSIGDSDRQEWFEDDCVRVAEYWVREEIKVDLVKMADGSVRTAEEYLDQEDDFLAAGLTIVDTREGRGYKVTQHWVGAGKVLESNDWAGRYIPIIPVYGDEFYIDGKMYLKSLIRDAKDPQRNFNYWRTNATEMIALAPKTPFIGKAGTFDTDEDKWATANVKNHAYIEYDGDTPPQRQPFVGPPAGAMQESLNASDDMKAIMGLHDASLGARSNETSGVAIRARQNEGDTSTFHFLDNMTRAIRQTGKVLVDLIPKVYSEPRILRILGEDKKPQNVQVNRPFPDPKQPGGPEKLYDLTAGKYDVTVAAGPGFDTKREEFVANVTEMMRAYPPAAPILMDLVAKNQDWPEADVVARRLHALLPPPILALEQGQQPPDPRAIQALQQQGQQMQQMQQVIQQLQQQLEKANADKSQAERDKAMADAHISDNEVLIARITGASKVQQSNAELSRTLIDASKPAQVEQPVVNEFPTV